MCVRTCVSACMYGLGLRAGHVILKGSSKK